MTTTYGYIPHNVRHQEWTVMWTMGLGWLWYANVGSSLAINGSFSWGMLIVGEATDVWGQKVCWKSVYLPLSDFTFTFHFHALEKEMATYSSVLAWRIPRMEEPRRLQSMGSHRVGHHWSDLAAAAAFFIVQLTHPYMTTGKTITLTRWTFVSKVMSLLFNKYAA